MGTCKTQQNDEYRDGKKVYYYNPTIKNEKGVSHNGRFIPITNEIRKILDELKANQEALSIALNSYVYVPMGLPVTERAKLLGHSVDTNLKHYTFARTDDYLEELSEMIDAFHAEDGVQDVRGTSALHRPKRSGDLGPGSKERFASK